MSLLSRFLSLWAILLIGCFPTEACTSVAASGLATRCGRPMLWKNRDSSCPDIKVEYVAPKEDGLIGYVGVFDAPDNLLEQAWAGLNEAGFAIINTASYNLGRQGVPDYKMDREGYLMAMALARCRTIADFERLLRTLPRPMGVEANFGVIDSSGRCAYFECDNYNFKHFDASAADGGLLVRTNYSHSGEKGKGFGQIRERNALHLLSPLMNGDAPDAETFLLRMSCSFYHDLLGRDMLADGETTWLVDQDFIPRHSTSCAIVIEGSDDPGDRVMWIAAGYPPVAEIYAVGCSPSGVPADLRGSLPGGKSLACERAMARKRDVFGVAPDGNASRYINVPALRRHMEAVRPANIATLRRLQHS